MLKIVSSILLAFTLVPLTASPAQATDDPSTPVLLAGNREAREWALNRPSRGTWAGPVRASAAVPSRWRSFAECVLRRESGGVLHNKQSREDARNGVSTASGRWQFLQAWQHGGSFMVRDRLIRFGMPQAKAREVRKHLGSKPIYQWDGWYQDILFNEVIERGGWHHWTGGRGCNALVPSGG